MPSPRLSVIVASHNRRDLLRRCLDSLCRQTQDPATFEAIVADDGSSDGTAEMVEGFDAPFALRVLRLEKSGQAAAQNAAIRASEAEVCLILDDDVIASPQLVAEHIAAHREDETLLGVGALSQQPRKARDPYARAFAESWELRRRELALREPDWVDCYGGNLSVRRNALVEVGGFTTDLAAVYDLDAAYRLCRAGCVPRYLPRAHAVHDDQKPGRRILTDQQHFGSWCARFAEAHPSTRVRLLGWLNESTIREATLRRRLLALRVPPMALLRAGRLMPGAERRKSWFGFVSLYAIWYGVRRTMDRNTWAETTRTVPVLLYHAFAERGPGDRFTIPKRAFARQMRALAALRYRVVDLQDLVLALQEGRALPRRAVAITIDDGYREILEVAHPILRRHRYPATVFLVSGRLGGKNDWDEEGALAGGPLLSMEEILRMRQDGIRFGAHTRTHVSLPGRSGEDLAAEIGGSRTDLESALAESVSSFAYPYGYFDDQAAAAAGRAGFSVACTARPLRVRLGEDRLRLPRIEIHGDDSLKRFLRKLWYGGG